MNMIVDERFKQLLPIFFIENLMHYLLFTIFYVYLYLYVFACFTTILGNIIKVTFSLLCHTVLMEVFELIYIYIVFLPFSFRYL